MIDIAVLTDLEKIQHLWRQFGAPACLFDHWSVRDCFQKEYNRPAYVIAAVWKGRLRGMLALSWIEETQTYGFFPGEVWQGNTWLEQNKLLAESREVAEELISHVPGAARIRYLSPMPFLNRIPDAGVDEVGFLFYPGYYGYSYNRYLASFSGKSRKKLRHELERLTMKGCTVRCNHFADIELMYLLNIERFKEQSYFNDTRFLNAFNRLINWLDENDMLRVTTVLIGGKAAAVDISAVYNGIHTVLAGGTHMDFPGVAKLINLHHLEWSCQQRFHEVDFLCGDFNWKSRFHLTPRPLYEIRRSTGEPQWQAMMLSQRTACAVG